MAYIIYKYLVSTEKEAKKISFKFLQELELDNVLTLGFPEFISFCSGWRVPLKYNYFYAIGQIIVDARKGLIDEKRTTSKDQLEDRISRKLEIKARRKDEC